MISPRQSFPVHSTHIVSLKYYDHNNDDADDDEVDADFDNVEAGSPERIDSPNTATNLTKMFFHCSRHLLVEVMTTGLLI